MRGEKAKADGKERRPTRMRADGDGRDARAARMRADGDGTGPGAGIPEQPHAVATPVRVPGLGKGPGHGALGTGTELG